MAVVTNGSSPGAPAAAVPLGAPAPEPTVSALQQLRKRYNGPGRAASISRGVVPAVVFLLVEHLVFNSQISDLIAGICLGALYGLVGVGLVLIYRTARVINFAAAAIGGVPAVTALLLTVQHGVNYLVALPLAFLGGPAIGALTDVVVVRRFSRSPRLILTVVTLGVAQTLGVIGFFIPIWLGARAGSTSNVPTPWGGFEIKNGRGTPVLTGNQIFALVVVVALSVGLGAFLRYTRIGIALRASAENADRASLLGIPVKAVQTTAWAIAGLVGAMAIYVSAPLIGVPADASLGFSTLLYALAAAVVGKMEKIGTTLGAGMAIGVLISASVTKSGDSSLATALMLPIIIGALLLQRGTLSRAMDSGVSSFQVLKEYRPIPAELRGLREVRSVRLGAFGLAAFLMIVLPFVIHQPLLPQLVLLPIYGIVAVSMVVLTGWAGQISLGQFGIVGVGAAVAGGMVGKHNIDFFAAMGLGIGAGVLAAVIIGLPALRVQGLYLAVTTLAFGFFVHDYVLNRHYWLGKKLLGTSVLANVDRPILLGRIDLTNLRSFYFACLVLLIIVMLAALSFRRLRSGRVLIAARDNQRAAPAYSINLVRTRLAAFAISGGMAGMAGVLLAYSERQVVQGSFAAQYSIIIFLATVIGGLTSVPWAVWGAVTLEAGALFVPNLLHSLVDTLFGSSVAGVLDSVFPLLLTGPLLIINLIQYPAGLAEGGFALRDRFLRGVAGKHNLLVPSLIADRRVIDDKESADVIRAAEAHVEEVESHVADTASVPVITVAPALVGAAAGKGARGFPRPGRRRAAPAEVQDPFADLRDDAPETPHVPGSTPDLGGRA